LTHLLVLTDQAELDLLETRDWYDRQRFGLGDDFMFAVDACFAQIECAPEAFVFSHERVRRALLKKFPYAVLFRVSEDEILIVGCLHTSRDRTSWEER
jgi:toxin ParE1/3/4